MIRILDIVLSATGLVLLSPLMLLVLLLAWLDTGSPLFAQRWVGRDQRPFTLLKFRTMRPGAASVASHLADASAITALGRCLRRAKIDELPQLWNVLKGEMSLVGPRPCLFNQKEYYERLKRARAVECLGRHQAHPGHIEGPVFGQAMTEWKNRLAGSIIWPARSPGGSIA